MKPIPKLGRKARREAAAIAAFNAAVAARSLGRCEAHGVFDPMTGLPICEQRAAHAAAPGAHHVWPEDRDCGRHEPDRGLHLCAAAHRYAHARPDRARLLGLLRPEDRTRLDELQRRA